MPSQRQMAKNRRQALAPYSGDYASQLETIRAMLADGFTARQIANHLAPNEAYRMATSIRYIVRRERIQALLVAS